MEATVSLALLVLVMIVALTLLFQMKAFAERQQMVTMPRQAARRAVDYLTFNVQGAADLNYVRAVRNVSPGVNNPNALICWYGANEATPNVLKQGSYNDVSSSSLADLGTDIVSLSVSENPLKVVITLGGDKHAAGGHAVNFSAGCPSTNMELFKQLTGAHTVGATEQSGLLTLIDNKGNWQYFQITDYGASDCTISGGATNYITGVKFDLGVSEWKGIAPNGELALVAPVTLAAGVQYVSFRVRNGNLEQKLGIFDADVDAPGTNFVPIVENIVDLQVAYLYANGTVGNSGTNRLADAGFTGGIPPQAGPCQGLTTGTCSSSATPFDATRDAQFVIGLRVTVVARSPRLTIAARSLASGAGARALANHFRPAVEDHAAGAVPAAGDPLYEYYRLTTTLLFRNRVLGS